MKDLVVYKLRFSTPVHISTQSGVGYEETEEVIHSDTLFSALMTVWNSIYDDNVANICETPPFHISSAFPFKEEIYFFPRPMIRIGKEGEEDLNTGKKLKKVKFISKDLFESVLQGIVPEFEEGATIQEGKFWLKKNIGRQQTCRIFEERESPRVVIDRLTNASEIFYFSKIIFEKDAGLFFLVRFIDKTMKRKFETVLRYLGDEGLGSDKRSGKGLYSLDIDDDFKLSVPQYADSFLTLSLYCPKEREFNGGIRENASYNLISRKGWIHSTDAMALRRKEVRMFVEGSVFNAIGGEVYGHNRCVLKKDEALGLKHNVYRYGIAFDLPLLRRQG